MSKSTNYRQSIFGKLNPNKPKQEYVKKIFTDLKSSSSNSPKFIRAAYLVVQEDIKTLSSIVSSVASPQTIWTVLFDQVDKTNRQALRSSFRPDILVEYDYKLQDPQSLSNKYDLIVSFGKDEFSSKVIVSALGKGKKTVGEIDVNVIANGSKHYKTSCAHELSLNINQIITECLADN